MYTGYISNRIDEFNPWRRIMNKYIKIGLGLIAGVAASFAVYKAIRRRKVMAESRPPFAEAAEGGES